ncbi:unnamed protein product [Discosporangium mesarthrocarpum]
MGLLMKLTWLLIWSLCDITGPLPPPRDPQQPISPSGSPGKDGKHTKDTKQPKDSRAKWGMTGNLGTVGGSDRHATGGKNGSKASSLANGVPPVKIITTSRDD